jgi:hypothetical protein
MVAVQSSFIGIGTVMLLDHAMLLPSTVPPVISMLPIGPELLPLKLLPSTSTVRIEV